MSVLLEKLTVGTRSVSQEVRLLCNPNVHCRVDKSQAPVLVLSQLNPICILLLYLPNIQFNTLLPSALWSSQWISLQIFQPYFVCLSHLPVCYMARTISSCLM
jgi:hypothetical protein